MYVEWICVSPEKKRVLACCAVCVESALSTLDHVNGKDNWRVSEASEILSGLFN